MTSQSHDSDLPEYEGNAFISCLPPISEEVDIYRDLDRPPIYSETDRKRHPAQRQHCVMRLADYSQPTAAAIGLGMALDLALRRGYIGRNPGTTDFIRSIQRMADSEQKVRKGVAFYDLKLADRSDTSVGFAVLGIPGSGKTHTIKRTCARYPQVVRHEQPCLIHQIVWLRVECPPTGSAKSLCLYFFEQVDLALRRFGVETEYSRQYQRQTLDVMLAGMSRIATIHAIGVIIVDEIQNVKRINHDVHASALNFLVTLRNSIGIPVIVVGTMGALPLLRRTFHDARRSDGIGMFFERLPSGPREVGFGPEFRTFLERLWQWQWTAEHTELDDAILRAMYDESQGIIDLVLKLFMAVQLRVISVASRRRLPETITPDLIRNVAAQRFRIVQPFVKALRENDIQKLAGFEDLIDLNKEFADLVGNVGYRQFEPVRDESHGSTSSNAGTAQTGRFDESTMDVLLAEHKIPPERRLDIIREVSRDADNASLEGMLAALARAVRADQEQHSSKGTSRKREPAIERDVRQGAIDGETKETVHDRLRKGGRIGFDRGGT